MGFKSGKTQSGENIFANFIFKKKSVYFSVYHLLFLKQLSQSYHCPKKAFSGLFWSFSVTTMFHLFYRCDSGVILVKYQSIIILQSKIDAAINFFGEKRHFLVKFDYIKNMEKTSCKNSFWVNIELLTRKKILTHLFLFVKLHMAPLVIVNTSF